MPCIYTFNKQKAVIGIWQITESVSALQAQATLHAYDLELLSKLTHTVRRQQWLAIRCLLPVLLPNHDQLAGIQYTAQKKPFLTACSSFKYISIAHSNNLAAIALSNHPIGIDIEALKTRNAAGVASKFLSAAEHELVKRLHPSINNHLNFWCAKEAVFKLVSSDTYCVNAITDLQILNPNSQFYSCLNVVYSRLGVQQAIYKVYLTNFDEIVLAFATT